MIEFSAKLMKKPKRLAIIVSASAAVLVLVSSLLMHLHFSVCIALLTYSLCHFSTLCFSHAHHSHMAALY